jgi:hypothetical protein
MRLSTPRPAAELSPPLNIHNELFRQAGLTLRKGQFSLWVAAPNVGKSVVANNFAAHAKDSTVFFSADSDEWTVRTRTAAILTGARLDDVEQHLVTPEWEQYYGERMKAVDHIDWSFRNDIDTEYIGLRLLAHAEITGDFPGFIVVDNMGNAMENPDDFGELRVICRELQVLGRKLGAHVMALHHVVGSKEDGAQPINLSDVLGKVSKLPEQVIGMSRANDQTLLVNVVKNRGGRRGSFHLPIDYPSARIGGFRFR